MSVPLDPDGLKAQRRPHLWREPVDDEPASPLPPFDADRDLWGAVFMVPDSHWKIRTSRPDHPGACVHYRAGDRSAILLKGTDVDNLRSQKGYYVVHPTDENGLETSTAFELYPRPFRLHKLLVYYPERYLGRLDESVKLAMCEELARLYPEEPTQ
jgi:hypothetical protein